jgi:hypothetical protein
MKVIVSLLIAMLAANSAFAQTAAKPVAVTVSVSIAPVDADVRDVLRDISTQSGARILIGTEVSGKLTMKLDKVSLDTALSVITKTVGLRYSRLTLPADKAGTLTAEQAAALVSAADTIAASGATGVTTGATTVAVAASGPHSVPAETAYLVQTKADPAAIKAAREEARKKVADKNQTAEEQAIAAKLSPDARDSNLVKAYSALQNLRPEQIATLTREFILRSTPEQREQIGQAMQQQREQFRNRPTQ